MNLACSQPCLLKIWSVSQLNGPHTTAVGYQLQTKQADLQQGAWGQPLASVSPVWSQPAPSALNSAFLELLLMQRVLIASHAQQGHRVGSPPGQVSPSSSVLCPLTTARPWAIKARLCKSGGSKGRQPWEVTAMLQLLENISGCWIMQRQCCTGRDVLSSPKGHCNTSRHSCQWSRTVAERSHSEAASHLYTKWKHSSAL